MFSGKQKVPLTSQTSFYFAVENAPHNLQSELILFLWVDEYKYSNLKGLAGMCSEYLNPPTCVNKYLTNRNTSEIALLMTDEHLSAVLPTATSTHTTNTAKHVNNRNQHNLSH